MMVSTPASLVIFNPEKRGLLPPVLDALHAAGFQPVTARPESGAAIDRMIRDHAGHVGRVIIGGGDGTIRHAAAALYETGLPLGILPLGTANDLAHSLGIPLDWQAAITVIAEGHIRAVDLGQVKGEYFFNAAQIGLGAVVGRWLSPRRKRFWGAWSYAVGAWDAFRYARPFEARLESADGVRRLSAVHITVGNGRQYGGGTLVAGDASITDGQLDLFSVDPLPPWRLAVVAAAIRTGRQNAFSHLHRWRGRQISITTDRPMPITADGEEIGMTPADFRVRPAAVRLFVSES